MRKLLLWLCLLALMPVAALGSVESTEQRINDGKWRLTNIRCEDECPASVEELLVRHGYEGWKCLMGVLTERKPLDPEDPRGETAALTLLEKNGLHSLVGISPSAVWDYGTLGLPLGQLVQMKAESSEEAGIQPRIGIETNEMIYHFCMDGSRGWFLSGWETKDGFQAEWYPRGQIKAQAERLPVWQSPYLSHIGSLAQLPKNMQELRAFSESSMQAWKVTGMAMLGDVNLRSSPTAEAEWLGTAHAGTLVKVLDRQPGKKDYWYQIQLGDLVCWASGPYVHLAENGTLSCLPFPLAVSRQKIALWDSDRQKEMAVVPEGTQMQILAEMKDDWMIVAVVQEGKETWRMEPASLIGWVQRKDLEIDW